MVDTFEDRRGRPLHPIHAIFLAGVIPLFFGALLSDWTYSNSYQVQWTNFASWLIAGGLVFAGFALLWAIINIIRADRPHDRGWLYLGLISATFIVGFFNALVHARDAWAAMPLGLILSVIALLLAIASNWAALSAKQPRGLQ